MKRSLGPLAFVLLMASMASCHTEVLGVIEGKPSSDALSSQEDISLPGDISSREDLTDASQTTPPEGTDPTQHTVPFTVYVSNGQNNLGIWLWQLDGTGYSSHDVLASDLAAIGVKRIYVKVADGSYNPSSWPEIADESLVQAYLSRGIEPWAWAYNYTGNEAAQAQSLLEAARTGYKGFVTDIEIEFDGETSKLEALMSAFSEARQEAINAGFTTSSFKFYCTTWGNPKDHVMHVEIIDKYVDAHMPQTYLEVWGSTYMQTATTQVETGTQEYRDMGALKPVHHIISAEKGLITASQIDAAFAASGKESSLWRVPGTGTPLSIWNTINAVDWHADFGGGQSGAVTVNCQSTFQVGVPGLVSGKAMGAIKRVVASVDGYQIQDMEVDQAGNYSFSYSFDTAGQNRVLRITGKNSFDETMAEVSTLVNVVNQDAAITPSTVQTTLPSQAVVGTPVTISGTSTPDVKFVVVTVDGWEVGSPQPLNGSYSFSYSFFNVGSARQVVTKGYDAAFVLLCQDVDFIDVNEVADDSLLTFSVPAQAQVGEPVSLSGSASLDIKTVKIEATGSIIAQAAVSGGHWSISHTFTSASPFLQLTAKGYDASGAFKVASTAQITIQPSVAEEASISVQGPAGAKVGVPVTFSGYISGDIQSVVVTVDGWQIAQVNPSASGWSCQYSFTNSGQNRVVSVSGMGSSGAVVATAQTTIDVAGETYLEFLSPVGSQVTNPVTFRLSASEDIAKVEYWADEQWLFGTMTNASQQFELSHTFSNLGQRSITVNGYDQFGVLLGTKTRVITVLSDSTTSNPSDVPYFYQYNNENEPCCTCANTSTAMLLAWYGWSGNPDTIYEEFGKTTAQSPAGLASVFNHYAAQMGILQRLEPHLDGTIAEVQALLAQGKPVIVHGYFTGSGHVLLLVGYQDGEYIVNDPAGQWAETFQGGYPYEWNQTVGHGIHYSADAMEAAIATSDGYTPDTIWFHEIVQ